MPKIVSASPYILNSIYKGSIRPLYSIQDFIATPSSYKHYTLFSCLMSYLFPATFKCDGTIGYLLFLLGNFSTSFCVTDEDNIMKIMKNDELEVNLNKIVICSKWFRP